MKVIQQETSVSTAVTCNSKSGRIDSVSSKLAQNASFTFTVNNDQLYDDNSLSIPSVQYSGAGLPVATLVSRDRFSFVVKVTNLASAALDASVGICFDIQP